MLFPRCPSLLYVTRKLSTLALGHSRSDQAAAKRRPISAKSHRPPTADAVVVTELSGSARASYKQIAPRMCRALRAAQTHECLANVFRDALRAASRGQPAYVPTQREQKITQSPGTQSDSQTCRERDGPKKKNDVARGSCLLHDVVGQQTGITSSINQKCEDCQPLKNSWIESHVM